VGGSVSEPRYPDVEVQLTGEDGNAFAVLGNVQRELRAYFREDGWTTGEAMKEINAFQDEAMSGDYDHLLRTCMGWVSVA
jgi:hypothetical protein